MTIRKEALSKAISDTKKWLDENKDDVDKVVQPADTWSKQAIELCAKDYGLTDTFYELDKCLADDLINLEQYLKVCLNFDKLKSEKLLLVLCVCQLTRRLARDQFMATAQLNN